MITLVLFFSFPQLTLPPSHVILPGEQRRSQGSIPPSLEAATMMAAARGRKLIFCKKKKCYQLLFLMPAETKISMLLSALVESFGISRMQDF